MTRDRNWRQTPPAEMVAAAASAVAHDLSNLFTAVISSLDLALAAGDLPDPVREDLHHARISAYRSADLVRRFRALARGSKGAPTLLSVESLVQATALNLRCRWGEQVQVEIEKPVEGLWTGRGDEQPWQEVILNLAAVASEGFGSGGGTIRLAMRNWQGEVPESNEREFICLELTDSGPPRTICPLPPFDGEKSVSRQFIKMAGLGFFMAKALAVWQGGWVEQVSVESGNQYRMYLPRGRTDAPKAPVQREGKREEGRILVVDDDATTRLVIRSILEFRGFQVLEAAGGEEALERCGTAERFDLVLLDLDMPRLDGRAVLRLLHERQIKLRILLMNHRENAVGALEFVEDTCGQVKKPFEREQLLQAVCGALARQ